MSPRHWQTPAQLRRQASSQTQTGSIGRRRDVTRRRRAATRRDRNRAVRNNITRRRYHRRPALREGNNAATRRCYSRINRKVRVLQQQHRQKY